MVNLNTVHCLQLTMLDQILAMSSQYNLNSFMIGGSVIGAVRHQGFIPWDDDIDVDFSRADFETFLRIAPDQFANKPLAVEQDSLDGAFEFDFAKVIRTDTWILESGREDTQALNGVFIDVFPFDRLPSSPILQQEQAYQIEALKDEITSRIYPKRIRDTKRIDLLVHKTLTELYQCRYDVMTQYNNDSHLPLTNMSSPYAYAKEVIKPEELNRLTLMPFESLNVPIMNGYDPYLKRMYGDYMTLPPIELQTSHHILKMKMISPIVGNIHSEGLDA